MDYFGNAVSQFTVLALAGTQHTLHVGVNVTPLDAAEWENALNHATGA